MDIARFYFIDAITELDLEARRIRCVSRVPSEGILFDSHFPGMPLFPGVLQIEVMAQAGGALVGHLRKPRKMPVVTSMTDIRLRKAVTPGAVLEVNARMTNANDRLAAVDANIVVDGTIRSEAKLRFALLSFPNQELAAFHDAIDDIVAIEAATT